MLEVHGDLKETADTSFLSPSLSSWPVKQPSQEEAMGGRGCQAPQGRKAQEAETHAVPQETLASGRGQLTYWDGRRHLTAKDMQGW